jgi:hypothetical protein
MKRNILLVLLILVFVTAGFRSDNKRENKVKAQLEMAELIQSGKFRFIARTANSELGNFNQLSYGYEMVFDSLKVNAYLPYYGRVYMVPYGGSGGVKFELIARKIDTKWNERRKLFFISTNLSDSQDSYSITLSAGLNGFADLSINFRNRRWISYYGIIEKIESPIK